MLSYKLIHKLALRSGFSLCGVARSRPLLEHSEPLHSWLSKGYADGLHYMHRNVEKRLDPAKLFKGTESIIVCAANYKNLRWKQNRGSNPYRVSSYAYSQDYHHTLKQMLFKISNEIIERYPHVKGRCFVDTAPILEKGWAVEAGLGWRGRNSLLITPQFGSFLFLGLIVLDAEFDHYDKPYTKDGCGNCTLCIESCPNGAINSDRTIDTRHCISRLTVERMAEGEVSSPDMLNGWLFGCDECQSCCPYNQKTPLYTLPELKPVVELELTTSDFWENLTEEEFTEHFASTPMERSGYEKISERIQQLKEYNRER